MDKYIGRLLDNRYEILEMIGSGGMAVVYKARCHRLNRLVAIKILKDDYLEDEDFRRRFHAESQAVAMLSHPNIVSVYDVSTSISMEADYIVMELIEGITLKQYMEKKGVLNWKETLHFAMQIAKALEHAHSRGVVHRDIKPHNVMVLKNGSVKVADFGIARLMSKGDTLTKEALGSVHYISPEQAKGGRVDNRSDIYSLGVVMYEMMSGRPPYEGDSPVSVAIAHINGGAIMPSTLNPNIPGGMEQIIMKAMAHELKDRYATATQMLTDMDEFRKDPAILFDYNTPPLDEVTKLNKPPLVLNNNKTTADRVEERAERKRRQPEKGPVVVPVGKTAPAKKKKEAVQKSSSSSGGGFGSAATIAIIACSLVCVIAILIILILALASPGGNKMVEVPPLVGKYMDTLSPIEGLTVKESRSVYNSEYEEGQIISQNPVGGTKVKQGTEIYVVVSKGDPEPTEMINLIGLTEEHARANLDSLSLETQVVVETEYNDKVDEGKVIRTKPELGETLTPGQAVTLWISLGPEPEETTEPAVERKKMISLVNLPFDTASSLLATMGFPEPVKNYVDSEEPEGTVVGQSVPKNQEVPIDTEIVLDVSRGPQETTEPPTDPPTETEPETKNVTIDLTGHIFEDGTKVEIKRDGETVYSNTVNAETTSVTVENQSGSGTVTYEVFINGVSVKTQEESF